MSNGILKEPQQQIKPLEVPIHAAMSSIGVVIAKIASATIGFVSIGYFLGYCTESAYFDSFKAAWLVDEIPTTQLLTHSMSGAGTLLSMFYYAIWMTDDESRNQQGKWYLRWPFIIFIICILLSGITAFEGGGILSYTLAIATNLSMFFSFKMILWHFMGKLSLWKQPTWFITIFTLLLFIKSSFFYDGTNRGNIDCSEKSTLSIVKVKGRESESLRLILIAGPRFWCVKLNKDSLPIIYLVAASDIVSVEPPSNK